MKINGISSIQTGKIEKQKLNKNIAQNPFYNTRYAADSVTFTGKRKGGLKQRLAAGVATVLFVLSSAFNLSGCAPKKDNAASSEAPSSSQSSVVEENSDYKEAENNTDESFAIDSKYEAFVDGLYDEITDPENIIDGTVRSEKAGDADHFVEESGRTADDEKGGVAWCGAYVTSIFENSGVELSDWYDNV